MWNILASRECDIIVDVSLIVDNVRPFKINLYVTFVHVWNVMHSCLNVEIIIHSIFDSSLNRTALKLN